MLTLTKIEKAPKSRNPNPTVCVSLETYAKIKEIAEETKIPIRRLTETLLKYALDNVEIKEE